MKLVLRSSSAELGGFTIRGMKRVRIVSALLMAVVVAGVVAVPLSVSMTGSGSLGEIQDDWVVTEDCTPHIPHDIFGSTGIADFKAGVTSTSRYVAENLAELEHDGSSWLGRVSKVTESGLDASVQVNGRLSFAVAEVTAAPVWFKDDNDVSFLTYGSGTGQVASPYDIAVDPVDGSIFVTSSGTVDGVDRTRVIKFTSAGVYVTEFGTSGSGNGQFGGSMQVAVAPDQSVWVSDGNNYRIQKFTRTNATTYTYAAKVGANGTGNGQFGSTGAWPIATDSSGNVYVGDRGNSRVQKFNSSAVYQAQGATVAGIASPYQLQVVGSEVYASDAITLGVAGSPGHLTIFSTSLGAPTRTLSIDSPVTGVSNSQPISGLTYFSVNADGTIWTSWLGGTFLMKVTATGVEVARWASNYPAPVQLNDVMAIELPSDDYGYVLFRKVTDPLSWGGYVNPYGGRYVTGFDMRPVPLSEAILGYLEACDPNLGGLTYDYQAAEDPDFVAPGFTGQMWAKIKELLTLHDLEIVVISGVITVRDVGSESLTISNNTPVTTTPSVSAQGQKIIATVQNPTPGGGVMWDAATDNSIYSVADAQRVDVDVVTTNWPVNLATPVPVDTLPLQSGQYYVVDSTGTPVPAETWRTNGGSVSAQLVGPQTIRLTFQGPVTPTGYTGPFYFANNRTSGATGTLTIGGNGVMVAPREVTIFTPADPANSQEVAFTYNSPFLDTLTRAYDRLTWASDAAAGPSVEIRFQIPTAQLGAFGQKLGAIIPWEGSAYRVKRIERGNLVSTITASRYTTLGALDAAWSGQTIGTRDTFWTGYSAGDRQIQPLLTSR